MQRELVAKILYVLLVLNIVFAGIYGYIIVSIISSNFRLHYVATSSMEPWVPQYSLVLVRRVTGIYYSLGDIVTYRYQVASNAPELFHRITGFQGTYVIVKGDAVNHSESIPFSSITGVYIYGVPYLGIIPALLYRYGIIVGLVLLLIVTLIVFFPYNSHPE